MKIKKYSYRVCFLLFFVITLLEFTLIEAFTWTGAFWKYILTAVSGIGVGIIIFLSDTYVGRILWKLIKIIIRFIEHSAWMEYPAP